MRGNNPYITLYYVLLYSIPTPVSNGASRSSVLGLACGVKVSVGPPVVGKMLATRTKKVDMMHSSAHFLVQVRSGTAVEV